jgi:4-hydroxy-3-methylbut-2-en-1-yl diphosphate reductase
MEDQDLILAFDDRNRLAVQEDRGMRGTPFLGAEAVTRLDATFPDHTPLRWAFTTREGTTAWRVGLCAVRPADDRSHHSFCVLGDLEQATGRVAPSLAAALRGLAPHLPALPYLHLGENDYIYRFRVEKDRNRGIYASDPAASALYQSRLCEAIKALARTNERQATSPAALDFGAVRYIIPSHFGFCLGVKNAIERAYETLAENPGRRVFMLSELIHNPFVNEDLLRRGLRYLQTDKGVPFTIEGRTAEDGADTPLLWDSLTGDDIVIIPAFGATDEDKARLVRRGLRVAPYDATCMLVEKVWKAARAFGREGYTVVIHGKSEHEETKATFSNARRHAPCIVVRTLEEARLIGDYIAAPDENRRQALLQRLGPVATPGFDPDRHLGRLAVVNQTTLLMNETVEIMDYFREVFTARFGPAEGPTRLGGAGRRDTLCYATQVNQDALSRALDQPLDAAFVIGGKNSSNTYQLYRLCAQKLGARAFFIQSEANIRSRDEIEHYVFPASGQSQAGLMEVQPLWPGEMEAKTVLLTGGASCPDGLIQQVIARINALFPADQLRPIDDVIADLA